MKCQTCEHKIKQSVNFCENCGATTSVLNTDLDYVTSENEKGQKLIFKGLVILCLSEIYHFSLGKIAYATGNGELLDVFGPISLVVGMLAAAVALLIALGLDTGKRRMYAIFLGSVYAFMNLFWIIELILS